MKAHGATKGKSSAPIFLPSISHDTAAPQTVKLRKPQGEPHSPALVVFSALVGVQTKGQAPQASGGATVGFFICNLIHTMKLAGCTDLPSRRQQNDDLAEKLSARRA